MPAISSTSKEKDGDFAFGDMAAEFWCNIIENGSKFESKAERGMWATTNKLFFECFYNGAPSGVYATKSDFWVHSLWIDGKSVGCIILPVVQLKAALDRLERRGWIKQEAVGDDGLSVGYLVPLHHMKELFSPSDTSI